MKPASFAYHRPATLDEAFDLLERHGPEGRILAGGQSARRTRVFRAPV